MHFDNSDYNSKVRSAADKSARALKKIEFWMRGFQLIIARISIVWGFFVVVVGLLFVSIVFLGIEQL